MPSFDIVKVSEPSTSFRAAAVMDGFDLHPEHVREQFKGSIDIENWSWHIGVIVGGSGSGKSTIANELFPEEITKAYQYSASSVIDDMPEGCSVGDITQAFSSVGFSSPPSWLKPYSVLSNGEKMRVSLARALLDGDALIVFDEFTSVVDRTIAKVGSMAIQKAIRRSEKQFVAVSCHRDILEWLEPDWIYDTDEQRFFDCRASSGPNSHSESPTLISLLDIDSGRSSDVITI